MRHETPSDVTYFYRLSVVLFQRTVDAVELQSAPRRQSPNRPADLWSEKHIVMVPVKTFREIWGTAVQIVLIQCSLSWRFSPAYGPAADEPRVIHFEAPRTQLMEVIQQKT